MDRRIPSGIVAPFSAIKVLGVARSRPSASHAHRLDVERDASDTSRPTSERRHRVAVIGAGMAGLTCARTLADHGLEVVVFDKGGRPGGRLATREAEAGEYDHGAQYFTVRDPGFERRVASWREAGLVAQWRGRIIRADANQRAPVSATTRRFVGVPGMNSIAAHLAADLDVCSRKQVGSVTRRDGRWFLTIGAREEGPFDSLVLAVPAPQAIPFLETLPELTRQVESVQMNPCWAVLVSFPSAIDTDFDGAFVDGSPLSWASRNASKPGRQTESWVLHASHEWSAEHLEDAPQLVIDALLGAFADLAQCALPRPIDLQAHLWRYALSAASLAAPCLSQQDAGIVVCGDWCSGPRVEDAFLSGSAAAGRLLGWTQSTDPPGQRSLF